MTNRVPCLKEVELEFIKIDEVGRMANEEVHDSAQKKDIRILKESEINRLIYYRLGDRIEEL